jgi:hypothetical protein
MNCPLRRLLLCLHTIKVCREDQREGNWGAMVGEMDWVGELEVVLNEIGEEVVRWPE